MPKTTDPVTEQLAKELRNSAENLIARCKELAEEAARLKQRAADLAQRVKQHDDKLYRR
jgi:uncharacterized protein (DUF3084 family)